MNDVLFELKIRKQRNSIPVSDFYRTYTLTYDAENEKYYTQTLFGTNDDFVESFLYVKEKYPEIFIETVFEAFTDIVNEYTHLVSLEKHTIKGKKYTYKIRKYCEQSTLFLEITLTNENFSDYIKFIKLAKKEYFENEEE